MIIIVFSQKNIQTNRKELLIDEDLYQDDPDVSRVIRRLQCAFVDEKTCKTMQLEKEISQTVEEYESVIRSKEKQLNSSIRLLQQLGVSEEEIVQKLGEGKDTVRGIIQNIEKGV